MGFLRLTFKFHERKKIPISSNSSIYIIILLLSTNTGSSPVPVPDTPNSPAESSVHHPFVGTFVFPHGGITLDAHTRDFSNEAAASPDAQTQAIRLHEAMRSAAKSLVQTKPDLIILSTPHGFYLEEHYIITHSPYMSGTAGWDWDNFTAKFNIAKPESVQLFLKLKNSIPVELLSLGIGQSPLPLHWGEVIPWWFIQTAALEADFNLPPVIYIGQPPSKNITQLLRLGSDIAVFAKEKLTNRRIAVVISADLSHQHSNDPRAPYPFHESAPVFDGYVQEWAKLNRDLSTEETSNDILLKRANGVADTAGSCGFTGLVMLHGLLSNLIQDSSNFIANFYEYAVPTYFGMTVTSWLPS